MKRKRRCRKRNFATKREAERNIIGVEALAYSKNQKHKTKLHAYLCPHCKTWHLGHPKK